MTKDELAPVLEPKIPEMPDAMFQTESYQEKRLSALIELRKRKDWAYSELMLKHEYEWE